ncbi:hypothetical protein [Salipaludibacillus sp. CF4.18]|uniref:hypothetical protein n=1 Tax=Salipaludibacillus sp. CF4.18 TaxID=3373081 RepID=UPI003EE4D480
MVKSRFFQVILRLLDWADKRKKELHFLSMTFFIVFAAMMGGNVYYKYSKNPMFENPSTIVEHLAIPIFISLFTIALVLFFGMFFTSFVMMAPFKKLKLFKMELEFDDKYAKEIMIANQFTFISTMLQNNSQTIKEMISENSTELNDVVEKLSLNYKRFVNEYNSGACLEIDVCKEEDVVAKQEQKLLEEIKRSSYISNAYVNRILSGNNLMVGLVEVSKELDNVVIITRSNYDYPFDHYDNESLASVIEYSIIDDKYDNFFAGRHR